MAHKHYTCDGCGNNAVEETRLNLEANIEMEFCYSCALKIVENKVEKELGLVENDEEYRAEIWARFEE